MAAMTLSIVLFNTCSGVRSATCWAQAGGAMEKARASKNGDGFMGFSIGTSI